MPSHTIADGIRHGDLLQNIAAAEFWNLAFMVHTVCVRACSCVVSVRAHVQVLDVAGCPKGNANYDTDSLQCVFSCTKVLAALVVARLVDRCAHNLPKGALNKPAGLSARCAHAQYKCNGNV